MHSSIKEIKRMANIISAFFKDNSAICNNILKNSHNLCTDILTIGIIVNVNGGRFYEFFLFHETAIMHRLITNLLLENNQQAGLVLHSGASHTYTTPNGAIFNNFSVFPFFQKNLS